MDIGKKNNDYCQGYEGLPKLCFQYQDMTGEIVKFNAWEGFFLDLLNEPTLSGVGWKGFTRDYHQCEGIWNDDEKHVTIEPEEYIADLEQYDNYQCDYPETKTMVKCLKEFLTDAAIQGKKVNAYIED